MSKMTRIALVNVLYNCGPTKATKEALAQSGIKSAEPVKGVKVDYTANELTLDRAVSCKAGDGVSMDYLGKAPDVGAFECK